MYIVHVHVHVYVYVYSEYPKRVFVFFECNNLLSPNQYGFRSGRSTVHAMLDFYNNLTDAINKDPPPPDISLGIVLDLKKAFDTVSHDLLLNKLQHYGIRGFHLIGLLVIWIPVIVQYIVCCYEWSRLLSPSRVNFRAIVISYLCKWFTIVLFIFKACIICWWHYFFLHLVGI